MKTQLSLAVLFTVLSSTAIASDVNRGKSLHDDNCIECHVSIQGGDGSGIYTRADRRIDSLPALRSQVNRCKNSMGVSWPEDQIDDVVAYPNNTYYKFPE
jgi:mono/diheme cytochrome c family protein